MDYNEVKIGFRHRHPWELSRTKCMYRAWHSYFTNPSLTEQQPVHYVNIGAGDCYFDRKLTEEYGFHLTAVDIAYENTPSEDGNTLLIRDLNESTQQFAFGLMMDSLEYMEDDIAYLRELTERITANGYIFLTLPAHKRMYSEHDRLVGNIRRYDKKDILRLVEEIDSLKLVQIRKFYMSLYLVRAFQKLFHIKVNPKVTTGWRHGKKSLMTRFITRVLNLDYRLSGILPFKGLSWMVILKVER